MERPLLDLDALRTALADRWSVVDVVTETASTNADLLARGAAAPDRTLLSAEFQNAGRGRFERVWASPPGAGLTTSYCSGRPRAPLAQWGWLPLLAGVAVTEAVRDVGGATASLKWPNDVLLGGDKVAGILSQSADGAVVIGIGINVSNTSDELPPGVAATSSGADGRGRRPHRPARRPGRPARRAGGAVGRLRGRRRRLRTRRRVPRGVRDVGAAGEGDARRRRGRHGRGA